MSKFNFTKTEDNSVGLYNNEVNDIYHSKTGAYTEAIDKFITPSKKNLQKNDIKILDICFGIGYNTKAAINNISKDSNVLIDCLEYDEELICLSPFINDSVKDNSIKIKLLSEVLTNNISIDKINKLLFENINNGINDFFDENMLNLIKFLAKRGYVTNPQDDLNSFLHNIYYNYISNSMYNCKKINKYNNLTIRFYIDDARKSIKNLNNTYDIVFLDAFSSQKDPTLWTIDFLSEIKNKMNDNSILVSYSKGTPFRSALVELGFQVGKTFIDGIDMGTVASMNINNIDNKLSDYDYKLISTRSGITYKDSGLNLSGYDILKNRDIEQKSSNRMSHTKFLKLNSK